MVPGLWSKTPTFVQQTLILTAINAIYTQLRYVLPLWFVQLITAWMPDNKVTIRLRGMLVKPFLGKCGRNFTLAGGVTINHSQGLHVGDNVYFARGTWINAKAGIYIGDDVLFGPHVVISSAQHVFHNGSFHSGQNIYRPIVIGKGSWLAANVTVKCGVTIGEGNLIASNSSVTSDTPDRAVMAGAPAVKVKDNTEGTGEPYPGVLPPRDKSNQG